MTKKRKSHKIKFSPKAFEMLNEHAGSVDVAQSEMWCCIPEWENNESVRKFGTTSTELENICRWFRHHHVTTVAMESTGIYWIPLYLKLIEHKIEVYLVNARFIKNVSGRPKTDKLDCQWLWRLHTFGLLRSSFLPDSETFQLRGYTRHRDTLIRAQATARQLMQKYLFTMNLNLDLVVSDIAGVSSLRIIKAITEGETDPKKLSAMGDSRLKHTKEEIEEALRGIYREELIFDLGQALDLFNFLNSQIADLDKEIEKFLQKRMAVKESSAVKNEPLSKVLKPKRQRHANDPHFNMVEMACRIYGVDSTAVPGVGPSTVLTMMAEAGTDFSPWPTAKHFTSWLGLSPSPDISGGKILKNKTRKVVNRLARAFRQAAQAVAKSHNFLGQYYRKKRYQKGSKKAITATARKIAEILYLMVTRQVEYADLGEHYHDERIKQKKVRFLRKEADRFGYELVEKDEKTA